MKDDLRRQHPLTHGLVGFKAQALDPKGHLKRKRWAMSLTLPSIFLTSLSSRKSHTTLHIAAKHRLVLHEHLILVFVVKTWVAETPVRSAAFRESPYELEHCMIKKFPAMLGATCNGNPQFAARVYLRWC